MPSTPPPPDLAGLFRWTPRSVTAAAELRARLLDATAERIGIVIARHSAAASQTLDELLALPRCERILLAPAMTALVARDYAGRTDGGVDAWTALSSALAAERSLAADVPAERAVWTALGDAYLPAGAAPSAPHAEGAAWREDAPYRASRVLADTVVDGFSPAALGWLPDIPTGDGALSAAAYATAIDKVRAACAAIEATSIHTALTIGSIARVIVVRADRALGEFRAASSPIGIGRIVLRNPQLATATVHEIMDGLVHETIHGLVDLVELDQPLVRRAFAGEQASSPWTSRALDLRTYVHACCVWFGLWHFWSRATVAAVDAGDDHRAALARRYVGLCTRGFRADGGILAPIAAHVALLADGVHGVLEQLQAEITETRHLVREAPWQASTTS